MKYQKIHVNRDEIDRLLAHHEESAQLYAAIGDYNLASMHIQRIDDLKSSLRDYDWRSTDE